MSLESASEQGKLFFKLKPREMEDLTKSFSTSEKKMFKLGAKQAMLDKVNDTNANYDLVNRMFSKNGDVQKLRYLFDNEQAYQTFAEQLRRETHFTMTRRALQGNSSTFQQFSDDARMTEKVNKVLTATSSVAGARAFVEKLHMHLSGLKSSKEYIDALETAGYLLVENGMDVKRLTKLLQKGSAPEISRRVRQAIGKKPTAPWAGATIGAGMPAGDQ
jgi:hypothetical protein